MFKKYLLTIFPALVFTLFLAVRADAFVISPAKILLTMDAGSEKAIVLNIKNDEKNDLSFSLYATGMKQDEQGRSVFTNEKMEEIGWVKPEFDKIFIKSGTDQDVKFLIKVPRGAYPGGYFFGLAVEPAVGVGEEVGLKGKSAAVVLLQVAGLANEALSIENWHAENLIFFSRKNWKFDLLCKNIGNIDVPMEAKAEIRNWNDKIIASQEIAMGNNLLSGTAREVKPKFSIPSDKIMWPGRYEARATIVYGRTGQTATAVYSVWYFPSWILWLILAVVLAFVFIEFYIYELKKHHPNHDS